jgi:hypothetical protein
MPAFSFEFGADAIIPAGQDRHFTDSREALINDAKPTTFLECLLVEELFHAQWEQHRVELASGNLALEEQLVAVSTRATRNWQRASKQLALLQTARAAAHALAAPHETVNAPCADLTRIPARKPASTKVLEWSRRQARERAFQQFQQQRKAE